MGTPPLVDRRLRISGCAIVASAVMGALGGCGNHTQHDVAWRACPRPTSAADIRRFRVRGGETCAHGKGILDYAAFGHEGMCGTDGCRYQGYTCRQQPGGLRANSTGGSDFTYEDAVCIRGRHEAAWRIVSH